MMQMSVVRQTIFVRNVNPYDIFTYNYIFFVILGSLLFCGLWPGWGTVFLLIRALL